MNFCLRLSLKKQLSFIEFLCGIMLMTLTFTISIFILSLSVWKIHSYVYWCRNISSYRSFPMFNREETDKTHPEHKLLTQFALSFDRIILRYFIIWWNYSWHAFKIILSVFTASVQKYNHYIFLYLATL